MTQPKNHMQLVEELKKGIEAVQNLNAATTAARNAKSPVELNIAKEQLTSALKNASQFNGNTALLSDTRSQNHNQNFHQETPIEKATSEANKELFNVNMKINKQNLSMSSEAPILETKKNESDLSYVLNKVETLLKQPDPDFNIREPGLDDLRKFKQELNERTIDLQSVRSDLKDAIDNDNVEDPAQFMKVLSEVLPNLNSKIDQTNQSIKQVEHIIESKFKNIMKNQSIPEEPGQSMSNRIK